LISLDERFDCVTYLNEGMPITSKTAVMLVTVSISMRVNPEFRRTVPLTERPLVNGNEIMLVTLQ
jgi:hypothetical protein